ncbi:purple acid phosphatase [Plakobranchus ocellatus]|uniref:Purple acid phosphatase n=1 Tax=Plakobranchus ocellatus TaxID=259542 RepID=A0AAV4BR92_9GAST|nr:purple acid phosphatase [Plakobranchus ocellatus]
MFSYLSRSNLQLCLAWICVLCYSQASKEQNTSTYFLYNENSTDTKHVDPCLPMHVHISFGSNVLDITVLWATLKDCPGKVKFGIHPWGLESTVNSMNIYFDEQNREGLHYLHKVELKGLQPDTTYFYIPMSDQMQSGPFYFKTPKADSDWSADFLMFGDLGIYSDTVPSLVTEALSGKYTALFHVGDFAYDMKNEGGRVGDYFFDLIEPAAASIPYMTCPGNHEIDLESFAHYRHRFAMPGSKWPLPMNKMWYSIDIGLVHFVSYSSEVFFTHNGKYVNEQKDWLIRDLDKANNNRHKVPWIVVFGHRPLYCSTNIGDDCSHSDSRVREGLEDVFYKLSVDIVIQGHEHNYERLWPLYKHKVLAHSYIDPPAPVQLISGAAGSVENVDHFPMKVKPEWSAFRLDTQAINSYGRMLVVNESHVFWEQRSIQNHLTLDSIWIVKSRNQTQVSSTTSKPGLSEEAKTLLSEMCNRSFVRCHRVLILSLCGGVFLLVAVSLAVRVAVRKKRKENFAKTWSQLPEEIDSDDEIGGNRGM